MKLALHFANESGKLLVTGDHAGQVTDLPIEGLLFDNLPRMRPGKKERERAEWFLNVVQVAQTLPHTFSVWEPSLAQVKDHRAYLMRPTAR